MLCFIKRRGYVIPEMFVPLFMMYCVRIGITYEEAENITSVDIINKIINEVEVP
jgi:hypothetical protein